MILFGAKANPHKNPVNFFAPSPLEKNLKTDYILDFKMTDKKIVIIFSILILGSLAANLIFAAVLVMLLKTGSPRTLFQDDLFSQNLILSSDLVEPQKARPDSSGLEAEILKILGDEKEKYAVYLKDLASDFEVKVNAEKNFYPASIYKVPLAIIILQEVDAGTLSLDEKQMIKPEDFAYSHDLLASRIGLEYRLDELLTYLIVYSDNTAGRVLERIVGGDQKVANKIDQLGLANFSRNPQSVDALSVFKVFEGIYNQSYLSNSSNLFLLHLLKNTCQEHQDRLAESLPQGVEVAHKIGTLETVYQDAGIIYGKSGDYILVVLNRDIKIDQAREKLQQISLVTYNFLNPQ